MPNGIKLARFAGLLPRVPDTLLPPVNATTANNCDFAYGELRSAAADVPEHALGASAASIYTDDGTLFYSWPTDVNAVRSPMANDLFNRLYYTTTTDFRVASRNSMSAAGGPPPSSYRVGVPRPAAAPSIALSSSGGTAGTASAATNAGVLPVYMHGTQSTNSSGFEYHAGAGMGPMVAAAHITLPVAGSVAVLVAWESLSFNPGDNFNVRVEVTADGAVMLAQSASGLAGYNESRAATGAVTLDAGEHVFQLSFGNDWTQGWWYLGQWSITLIPVQVEGETLPAADPPPDVTRAYVWTQVNTYGEEGPPSPPAMFTFPLGAVDVSVPYAPPADDYAPLKEVRIYRTPDSSSIAEYFYVGKIDVLGVGAGTVTFHDDVQAAELNEALASMNYYPPDPALVGLLQLPNGILMAWKGNEMHFSDAYKPWSWPPQYRLTFGDYNVVGAIAVGASALVTTTGKPYVVAGVSPDSMTYSVLNTQQAGASKWALADLGGQIVYASHDGIVAFDGGLPSMAMSEIYFTRDVWRAKYGAGLASMRFAVWDGRLIVYSAEDAFTPFMLGLDEARGAMTELPNLRAQCSFVSPVADQCFVVNGSSLVRVAGGPLLTANWISRTFIMLRPCNFSVAQAVCSGSWTVDFYADGVLRHTQAGLDGNVTFRLPSGFLSDRWQVAIHGTGVFRELRVAETTTDLKAM
jgi:hypothetical protein